MSNALFDSRRLSPRRRKRRGIALLMTFVIVLIYLILSVHLQYVATFYVRSVNANKDRLYAEMTAMSGVVKAKANLRLDSNAAFDSLNETWANTKSLAMQSGVDYGENAGISDVNAETFDESGRFNLNLLAWAKEQGDRELTDKIEEFFDRLVLILRREDGRIQFDEFAEDYEGPNDDRSPANIMRGLVEYLTDRSGGDVGDKASYGFDPKDRERAVEKQGPWPIVTLGELLSAEYVTESVLYGPRYKTEASEEDSNDRNSRSFDYVENRRDPSTGETLSNRDIAVNQAGEARASSAEERSTSKVPLPLIDFVTIWGDGRININTCEREILLAMSEDMSWEMSTAIMRARDAAYDRNARVAEDNIADEVDPNDPPAEDANAATEEEDNRSFRDGTGTTPTTPTTPTPGQPAGQPAANANDISTAMAFYNRIAGALGESSEEFKEFNYEPVDKAEDVPEEWQKVFDDMRPFLTVRSEYFRIVSKASAAEESAESGAGGGQSPRQFCTVTAVYRRVVGQAPAAAGATPNAGTNTPTNTPTSGTNSESEYQVPPEPTTSLELIYQDVSYSAPRQRKN